TQKETPRMGDTGNCEVNAARHGALRRPLELRVSRSARVEWAPVPERDPCEPDATVVPGSVRRPRRSSAHGTGWPSNSNSWYGQSPCRSAVRLCGFLGDHTARIVFRIAVGMASDFRCIDDAPFVLQVFVLL